MNIITRNDVSNRFLPLPESVLKGLESEPKITDFNIIKELGAGSFGRVILVSHKITKAKYAIKAIDKRNKVNIVEKPYFRREIEILYRVHHPNIVKLFGHFEDNVYCYFIMEYLPRGNIISLMEKNPGLPRLSTQVVASIMKDIICATYFLHNMNPPIIHRDIKPENVLLDESLRAKLIDFGWSNYIQGDMKRNTYCGTITYLAPEIINSTGHDERVDIWCIGVLLFVMMNGYAPFQGGNGDLVKYNIRNFRIAWPKEMDRDSLDLIRKILKYNPEERISLDQMLLHPFFTKFFPNAYASLIKPDINAQYKVFIVSKDNPLTWNPVFNGNNINLRLNPFPYAVNYINPSVQYNQVVSPVPTTQVITTNPILPVDYQENYNNLVVKYENLQKQYYDLRTIGYSDAALNSLRMELKQKEDRINQIVKNTGGYGYTTGNELQVTYDDLLTENNDLRNKLNLYKTQYQSENGYIIANDLNALRNSIVNNNKAEFTQAVDNLRTNIDNMTLLHYNTIIMQKDKELQQWNEAVRLRKEREKQHFTALMNRYDRNLSMSERENEQLKLRLQQLQQQFV